MEQEGLIVFTEKTHSTIGNMPTNANTSHRIGLLTSEVLTLGHSSTRGRSQRENEERSSSIWLIIKLREGERMQGRRTGGLCVNF